MKIGLAMLLGALALIGCGGSGGENEAPSPNEISAAFEELAGGCILVGADPFTTKMPYDEWQAMRRQLAVITTAVEKDPETPAGEGATAGELLYEEVIPMLRGCDPRLLREAQIAARAVGA